MQAVKRAIVSNVGKVSFLTMNRILLKKSKITWALLFISLASLNNITLAEEKKDKPRFSIKLTGGLRYMNVGDINNHLESFDNYMSSEILFYEGGKTEKINNYGLDVEGELRLEISSKFSLGVSIGYIYGKNKTDFQTVGFFPFQVPPVDFSLFDFTTEAKVKAYPLKFGIYYTLPIKPKINLFFNGGLGYYFSSGHLYKFNWILPLGRIPSRHEISNEYDVNGSGLGFHGGIGFEYKLLSNLIFIIEAQGRYAKIKNLKGSEIYNNSWNSIQGKNEGILYVGERDMTGEGYGQYCPDLIVSASRPGGDEFRDIRKAVLDFSGFSLKVGIRIKLF